MLLGDRTIKVCEEKRAYQIAGNSYTLFVLTTNEMVNDFEDLIMQRIPNV